MFENRRPDPSHRRSQPVFVFAALLLGVAFFSGTNPATAQTPLPDVIVYHSPADDSVDQRSEFPPGCGGGAGVGSGGMVASTGNNGVSLITVDTATGAGTLIGPLNAFGPVTDLAFRYDGVLFGTTGGGTKSVINIDEFGVETLVGTHVDGAVTGLEFVGTTLYGTFIATGGGSSPSQLVTVDQATGALTSIGATGFGPIGGLAFDSATGILYGATSGTSSGDLVSIDLATGAATLIGSTGLGDVAALTFGPSGVLYGGLGGNSEGAGSLITIDPATGAGTIVGSSGYPVLSGLSRSLDCVINGAPGGELYVWIDGGDIVDEGTVCKLGVDGSRGAELCGADLLFEIDGPGYFTHFDPDVNLTTLVHHPDCVNAESEVCELPPLTKQLRMNFTRGATTPSAIARRIGMLTIDSSLTTLVPYAPTTVTISGVAAGANLQLRQIAAGGIDNVAETIQLPEPGAIASLTTGLLGLGFLNRRRRARSYLKPGHREEA
jgi:hypothetical protein